MAIGAMATFRAIVYDPSGRRQVRSMVAVSADQVKLTLWAQGLHVVDIAPRLVPDMACLFPRLIRVGRAELALFTRQLATFCRAGISILDGLQVLYEQASSSLMRRALEGMIADLGAGAALSTAISRQPRVFPPLYADLIRSAEAAGGLEAVLQHLADYLSREERAARRLRNALVYPIVVCCLALAVVSVLIGFVLPAFADLFSDFGATMPLPTRLLLAVGDFCRLHVPAIFGSAAVLGVAMVLAARTRGGRERWQRLQLRLPLLGQLVRYAMVERYLRALAALARAGVPPATMLRTAAAATGNVEFEQALAAVQPAMLSGEGLAGPLERTGLFPRLALQMVRVGEETGRLDANLEQAAEHYAEETDYRTARLMAVLEPALVIAVGVVVAFIGISVIGPMYALVHVIR